MDFIATQLETLAAFEYVRLWTPNLGSNPEVVVEIMRTDEGPGYDVKLRVDLPPARLGELEALGFSEKVKERRVEETEELSRLVAKLVDIVVPGTNPKLSLTHGSCRDEILTARKLRTVVEEINRAMAARNLAAASPARGRM